MSTDTTVTGHLHYARDVRKGWCLHFSGTFDIKTLEADFTPFWREVASVERLPVDPHDRRQRPIRITYTDGAVEDWRAMADVHALTARQAQEAGLCGDER